MLYSCKRLDVKHTDAEKYIGRTMMMRFWECDPELNGWELGPVSGVYDDTGKIGTPLDCEFFGEI
jgi:hypothetical protein